MSKLECIVVADGEPLPGFFTLKDAERAAAAKLASGCRVVSVATASFAFCFGNNPVVNEAANEVALALFKARCKQGVDSKLKSVKAP